MSWFDPTATIVSPLIAIACASGFASSTVTIFPLRRTRSAGRTDGCVVDWSAKAFAERSAGTTQTQHVTTSESGMNRIMASSVAPLALPRRQIRRADAQMSGRRAVERRQDDEGQQRVREGERDQVRVPVVDGAPDERGDEGDRGEKWIGHVQRREERGRDEDACGSGTRRLCFTEQRDLQRELLTERPEQQQADVRGGQRRRMPSMPRTSGRKEDGCLGGREDRRQQQRACEVAARDTPFVRAPRAHERKRQDDC